MSAEKGREAERLRDELSRQLKQVDAAKAQVDSMVKYQQYLETVVRFRSNGDGSGAGSGGGPGQGGEFQDIDEVIGKRYPTLLHAYHQLEDAVKDNASQLESGRRRPLLCRALQACTCGAASKIRVHPRSCSLFEGVLQHIPATVILDIRI